MDRINPFEISKLIDWILFENQYFSTLYIILKNKDSKEIK